MAITTTMTRQDLRAKLRKAASASAKLPGAVKSVRRENHPSSVDKHKPSPLPLSRRSPLTISSKVTSSSHSFASQTEEGSTAVPTSTSTATPVISSLSTMFHIEAALYLLVSKKRQHSPQEEVRFQNTVTICQFCELACHARQQEQSSLSTHTLHEAALSDSKTVAFQKLRSMESKKAGNVSADHNQDDLLRWADLNEEERILVQMVIMAPELYKLSLLDVQTKLNNFQMTSPFVSGNTTVETNGNNKKQLESPEAKQMLYLELVNDNPESSQKNKSRMSTLRALYKERSLNHENVTSFSLKHNGTRDIQTAIDQIIQWRNSCDKCHVGDIRSTANKRLRSDPCDADGKSLSEGAAGAEISKHGTSGANLWVNTLSSDESYITEDMSLVERIQARANERERREAELLLRRQANKRRKLSHSPSSCDVNDGDGYWIAQDDTTLLQVADALWLFMRTKKLSSQKHSGVAFRSCNLVNQSGERQSLFYDRSFTSSRKTGTASAGGTMSASLQELQRKLIGAASAAPAIRGRATPKQVRKILLELAMIFPEWITVREESRHGTNTLGGQKNDKTKMEQLQKPIFSIKNDVHFFRSIRTKLGGAVQQEN